MPIGQEDSHKNYIIKNYNHHFQSTNEWYASFKDPFWEPLINFKLRAQQNQIRIPSSYVRNKSMTEEAYQAHILAIPLSDYLLSVLPEERYQLGIDDRRIGYLLCILAVKITPWKPDHQRVKIDLLYKPEVIRSLNLSLEQLIPFFST